MGKGITDVLIDKGVIMISPQTVHVGDDVIPENISAGVAIYPGCRISGKNTCIGKGSRLGAEGPVTIENCAIGKDVELKGGYLRDSVFLDRSNMGMAAHVREACILEEEASAAHAAGLKQTILFPFVTLGSLVNFCDCMMAGGTGKKDHSEVGSSYIHFNFTPNQDKATPSLIGDVARGVFLRERPIFLGGQGGLVGPARVGFGSVIAAGIVFRGELEDGMLYTGASSPERRHPYIPGVYADIGKKLKCNIAYMANLIALKAWYRNVRSAFLPEPVLTAALSCLEKALDERISRLGALASKMPESVKGLEKMQMRGKSRIIVLQKAFHSKWPEMEAGLNRLRDFEGDEKSRGGFLSGLPAKCGDYIEAVQVLDADAVRIGISWLSSIVDKVEGQGLFV